MKKLILLSIVFLFAGYGGLYAQEYLEMMNDPDANFYDIKQEAEAYFMYRDKGKGSGYKQYKRWEAYMEPRVFPSGVLYNTDAASWDEYHEYTRKRAIEKASGRLMEGPGGNWEFVGPIGYVYNENGNKGGIGVITCIAEDPANSNTIYIGAPTGGLWKSETGVGDWQPLTDGLPSVNIYGIAVDPLNSNVIYIATGTGLLKTFDGGDSWFSTGLSWDSNNTGFTASANFFRIAIPPGQSDTLFVTNYDGLHRSVDGGLSWNIKQAGKFYDIEIKPGDASTLYAASEDGIYRSTNYGDSWNLTAVNDLPASDFIRIELAVTPATPDYVYALYAQNHISGSGTRTPFKGLYRSENSGADFTLRSATPNILGYEVDGSTNNDGDWNGSPQYNMTIAASPTDPDEIHIGGINCWKSEDGGQSWTITSDRNESDNDKFTHADIRELRFINGSLYCVSDGGVYKSDNPSHNSNLEWHQISSGLANTMIHRIGGTPQNPDLYVMGTQDNGIIKIDNSSQSQIISGDAYEVAINPLNTNVIQKGGRITFDGGLNWKKIKPREIENNDGIKGIDDKPILFNPLAPTIIYRGDVDVWENRNAVHENSITQDNWNNISANQIGNNNKITAMVIHPSDTTYIYVAKGSTMYRREIDNLGNVTWPNIKGNLPNQTISYIAVSDDNPDHIWVCFSSYVAGEKVYKTTTGGNTWTNVSGNSLPDLPANGIIYDNNSNNNAIYLAMDIGVYYRNDNLSDWVPFMNGLPRVRVNEIEINYASNQIVAGTYGRGLWRSDLYSVCEATLAVNDTLWGYRLYEAGNTITSTAVLQGAAGTEVIFQAGSDITLQPGFHASPGNTFRASIAACSQGGIPVAKGIRGTYAGPMPGIVKNTGEEEAGEDMQEDLSVAVTESLLLYPNPFSSQVTVEFFLKNASPVSLRIIDMNGREMQRVINGEFYNPGRYQLNVRSDHWPEGFYFCQLETNTGQETKKIILRR